MKKIITSLALLFAVNTFSQVDSVLFGLSIAVSGGSVNPSSSSYLVKINPSTGVLTNSAPSLTAGGIQVGNSTIDSYNKVFYYMNSNQIVGLSLYTGSVVSSHSITNANASYMHNMQFNCGDTTIYALARTVGTPTNPASASLFLAKVNPNTGVVTNISQNSIGNSVQLNNVTIDPYNKIYYYVTQNSLIGLSLTTGTIVSTATLSNPSSTIAFMYSSILYNRSDSTLYGLARSPATVSNNPSTASIYLAKFTPAGIASIISPTSVASNMQVANASIDPYAKVYYFTSANHQLIGVSLLSGLTVSSPTISNPAGGNSFLEMNYNCNFCPEPKQDFVTSIKEVSDQENYVFYPNPVLGHAYLQLKQQGDYTLEIMDLSGRLVLSSKIQNGNKIELNLSDFEKGIYLLKIHSSGQNIKTQKFLISE